MLNERQSSAQQKLRVQSAGYTIKHSMPAMKLVIGLAATAHALVAPTTPHQRLAPTNAVADLLRDAKLDIPWLAEGDAPKENKVNIPDSAKRIFALPTAPKRTAESPERVEEVRARARTAARGATTRAEVAQTAEDMVFLVRSERMP